jgi:hypothetical protein
MLPMRELYAACNDSDHARESVTRLVLSWVHCDENDLVLADAGSFSDMHLFGLGLCHVLCTHDPLATRVYDAKEELGEFLEPLTAGVDIHASSWIELRQLIRALQTSYPQLITYDRFAGYDCLVDVSKYVLVLMTRVGALLGTMFRWDSVAPEDQVRLSEFYEHEADGFHILKARTCAEAIDVLHSLTRLVLTLVHATPVGAAASKPDLTKFHHEASLDDFYQLATAQDCLPGSIAAYKNQFHGLFHDVSQVAYYLYPTYTRRVQVPIADFAQKHHLFCDTHLEGDDGETSRSETSSLLSYTLRYVSFAEVVSFGEVGSVCRVPWREPIHLCTYGDPTGSAGILRSRNRFIITGK